MPRWSQWGRQFALPLVEPRPALVPLRFDAAQWAPYAALAGLSLPVRIANGAGRHAVSFDEDLLFTHRGLSGPAILQISSYWREGDEISVNLLPGVDAAGALRATKARSGKAQLATALAGLLPERLARHMAEISGLFGPMAEMRSDALDRVAAGLQDWRLKPVGSEGYRTAEVTLGGTYYVNFTYGNSTVGPGPHCPAGGGACSADVQNQIQ